MTKFKTADEVFAAMCQIVEAPGYPLLQHYKDDLYLYDKQFLQSEWHEFAHAIWVVRKCGTHLNFVGCHERSVEHVKAALSVCDATSQIFSITSNGIKPVTSATALAIARKVIYRMDKGLVLHLDKPIASYDLRLRRSKADLVADVHFQSDKLFSNINAHRIMLETLAGFEAVAKSQTLFVKLGDITLNAQSLSRKEVLETA